MRQHGVLEDCAPSNERDGPRCKCGARMIVSLSDAVQYWVDETNPGTSPYFTSTKAGAADAARRGWRRIIPKHHHAPAAQVGANASAAVENVHREDDVEGWSAGIPVQSRDRRRRAGWLHELGGCAHAPLRGWTRRKALKKAGISREAEKTIGAQPCQRCLLTHGRNCKGFGLDSDGREAPGGGGRSSPRRSGSSRCQNTRQAW